jgi:transposase
MVSRTRQLAADLKQKYGVVLSARQIARVVGVRSKSSLSRWLAAAQADGLKLFQLPRKKGKFVLAGDLAQWLSDRAERQTTEEGPKIFGQGGDVDT